MKYVVLCLLISISSTAQNKMRLGALAEYSENSIIRNGSIGINLEILLGKEQKIALNYKFLVGASSDKAFYFHSTLGGFSGGYLLSKLGKEDFKTINTIGLLLCFAPEGLTYYPNPDIKLSPGFYINPLGSDYWFKKNSYENFKVSSELGGKLLFNQSQKISLQAHVGLRYLYGHQNMNPIFITAGFGIVFIDF